MSFNKSELIAPEWLNTDFLEQLLESCENCKNIKIIDYELSPATKFGEHFASIMFRVKIKYSTNQNSNAVISIIIKTLPVEEGIKKEMLRSLTLFETEIFMYCKVLPTCKEIVRQAGYMDLLAPKMLYHSLEPRNIIAFEDLKELGYFMYPDFNIKKEDIKRIFAKLAQVHASTFKMEADGNTKITELRGTCLSGDDAKNTELFKSGLPLMVEAVKTIPGLESCLAKLEQFTVDDLLDKCIAALSIPGSYNVLNHGDFHIRNMMFKDNDDKNTSEIVLLDFQLCHWGSPAHDLLCFASLVPFDFRDELLKDYFNNFINIITKCGYKGNLPSYAQLQEELVKYRHIEIFLTATFAPFVGVELNKMEVDVDSFMTNRNYRLAFYKTEKYVSLLKQMLPIYLEQGHFDDIINK